MVLLIDNYDSFSYNLYQYIGKFDSNIQVYKNDSLSIEEIKKMKPSHIILSPGPGRPKDAGIIEDIVTLTVQRLNMVRTGNKFVVLELQQYSKTQ